MHKQKKGAVNHSLRQRLEIGKQIKTALDAIVPENCRLTDKEIAKKLGLSQQYVTRVELLALYKIRMRFRELLKDEEMVSNQLPV